MKRISIILAAALFVAPALRAQDAAVQERLDKLSGQIENLIEVKEAQNKRIDELARAIRELQDQQNKPNATYASQEDLKRLAARLQEIDQNRQHDNELILEKLRGLGKTIATSSPPPPRPTPSSSQTSDGGINGGGAPPRPEKGYEYVVKENDTPMAIAKAYNDQGVKVTYKQILAANPGLKAENLKVGQKIFIPMPAQ